MLTDFEIKHLANTITLALPKKDESFSHDFMDVRGPSGFETMGLKKPNFATVGAGSMPSCDRKGEIIGQKKVKLSKFGTTKERSYSPKIYRIIMTEDDFNLLMKDLTQDEMLVFNNHRGVKKIWWWDTDRFRSSHAPKKQFDSLTTKLIYSSMIMEIKKQDEITRYKLIKHTNTHDIVKRPKQNPNFELVNA